MQARRSRGTTCGGGAVIRFVLHRPRSSQNIGAAARAIANTGAGALWTVEPLGFDRAQAAKLAAGADQVLEAMRVVRTIEEAVEDCVDVVMTTGRAVPGALDPRATARRLLDAPGEAALVFGDEILLARGEAKAPRSPERPLADEQLLAMLRKRARDLLSRVGFLNPQQPDRALDELLQLPRRARATRREVEMLLAALEQIARSVR